MQFNLHGRGSNEFAQQIINRPACALRASAAGYRTCLGTRKMFSFLRRPKKTKILKDEDAFWRYADETQKFLHTPIGMASEAEERLDLRAATALKELLEASIGPEEGPNAAQLQNWDWNDDRCRRVMILRSSFSPNLVRDIQDMLVGEFADFHVLIAIFEDWENPAWGHLQVSANELGVQRNVAQAYAISA